MDTYLADRDNVVGGVEHDSLVHDFRRRISRYLEVGAQFLGVPLKQDLHPYIRVFLGERECELQAPGSSHRQCEY